jgi:hypothetical protein
MTHLKLVTDPLPLDFGRNKRFCVYVYFDPRPRKKRQAIYVGKGLTEQRPDQHWRRGSHNLVLQSVLDDLAEVNLEPIIEYAGFFDREGDALKYEQGLIAKYGRRNIGTGSLCNLSAVDGRRSQAAATCEGLPWVVAHVRVPASMLLEIDALIGKRFIDRAEAIRSLLRDALRGRP